MKGIKFLSIILLVCLVIPASAQDKPTENKYIINWKKKKLEGLVKSIIWKKYRVKEGSDSLSRGEMTKNDYYFFNEQGYLYKQLMCRTDGSINYQENWQYNKQNKLLKYETRFSDGSIDRKIVYTYNNKRQLVKEEVYLGPPMTFTYDKQGNMTERCEHSIFGDRKESFEYDDKARLIVHKKYTEKKRLLSKTTYKYDEKGNVIEKCVYEPDGSLFRKSEYKYDEDSNNTEYRYYKADGRLLIESTYRYDSNNNVILEKPGVFANDRHIYAYVYDEKGNWIRKVSYNSRIIATDIEEREIEYFE